MANDQSDFASLTWDDLAMWAQAAGLSKGRSYKSQVRDLNMTKSGWILAWVQGSELYATAVSIDSSGKLSSSCSCPSYWNPCKHSVAAVLSFLDALKNKEDVPEASQNDQRIRLIVGKKDGRAVNWETDDEEDADFDSEFPETFKGSEGDDFPDLPADPPSRSRKKSRATAVRQRLDSMNKDQLVEFVLNLADKYPDIGVRIEEEEDVKSGRISKTVKSIRAEIENLASEPGWQRHWSGQGYIPDYSHVRERLESLLNSGHADEVLGLGDDLWILGNEQVESSDDEGETGEQIADCMKVVFQAVSKSTLSHPDQILWMIETFLKDEFELLEYPADYFQTHQYDTNAWSQVTDELLNRLDNLPVANKEDHFSEVLRRRKIMDWAIMALEFAGREQEIIPLLKREAPITQCYILLIDHLLKAGMRAEARSTAVEGFRLTLGDAPGIAWELEDRLRKMAEGENQPSMVAAYRALEFFNHPSLESYKKLKQQAKSVDEWPTVKKAAITFLQTGARPDVKAKNKGKVVTADIKPWPFPDPEISIEPKTSPYVRFPNVSCLIEISIHEKDVNEILRWYAIGRKTPYIGNAFDSEVADAVKNSHPDESLKIWRNIAEKQINLVKTTAYEVAARYLRQMRDVYQKNQRFDEWNALIAQIRAKHKAKRNLMQILDGLVGKRIIDG